MRKIVLLLMLFCLMALCFFTLFKTGTASGETLHVGTGQTYSKIQDAINAASFGDTVYVKSGTYYEHLTVNKNISLVGESPASTIIDGGGVGTVVYVIAGYVTVANFTIIHSGEEWLDSGIRLNGVNNCTIKNNLIVENRDGIRIEVSSNILIEHNNITRSAWLRYSNGIYIDQSDHIIIRKNCIGGVWPPNVGRPYSLYYCIRTRSSTNNLLQENELYSRLELMGFSNSAVYNNSIKTQYGGMKIQGDLNDIRGNSISGGFLNIEGNQTRFEANSLSNLYMIANNRF